MRPLLLAASALLSLPALGAPPAASVDLISPGREYLYVDDAWQSRAECVEAKISFSQPTSYKAITIKAYLYSADGKLLHFENKPSSQGDGNGAVVPWPDEMKPGRKYSFFFAIPKKYQDGASKWKRALIVAGSPGKGFDAKVYPKDDLTKFEFAEKAALAKP